MKIDEADRGLGVCSLQQPATAAFTPSQGILKRGKRVSGPRLLPADANSPRLAVSRFAKTSDNQRERAQPCTDLSEWPLRQQEPEAKEPEGHLHLLARAEVAAATDSRSKPPALILYDQGLGDSTTPAR